ncbi:DNA polymerase V [Ewingella americana]|nr:DNA polymerase V [Ewingella americana]KAA8729864.1 DNA polymerase V [Ewingella americana]
MSRRYEIDAAFKAAIKISEKGRRTVATEDFCAQLGKANCRWGLKEANQWIEMYVSTFRDVSETDGERRVFMFYNPNGGR